MQNPPAKMVNTNFIQFWYTSFGDPFSRKKPSCHQFWSMYILRDAFGQTKSCANRRTPFRKVRPRFSQCAHWYISKSNRHVSGQIPILTTIQDDQSPVRFYSLFCPWFFSMNQDWLWHRKIWYWYMKPYLLLYLLNIRAPKAHDFFVDFSFKYASTPKARANIFNEILKTSLIIQIHFQGNQTKKKS